ncbi:lipoyl(octanoyl) transferase LipB [Proteobacteria bacterium 005FR1]|nr:lipoyl(octanoyl) transferase LipB [Proteobacteria bacterium 005FR1]
MPESGTVLVRELGLEDYEPVWRRMIEFTDRREDSTQDEIWLVQHPPVFTLGQAGRREHLLSPGDIPVIACDRGGQVTYHGPGQLVLYPLLNLHRLKIGVRAIVELMEESLIRTLQHFGIEAQRRAGAPGVYVGEAKIAALGLRIRRGCSFHGLSLNVDMDLEPFQRINPCGYAGMPVVQVRELATIGQQPTVDDMSQVLVENLCELLGCGVQWPPRTSQPATLTSI